MDDMYTDVSLLCWTVQFALCIFYIVKLIDKFGQFEIIYAIYVVSRLSRLSTSLFNKSISINLSELVFRREEKLEKKYE